MRFPRRQLRAINSCFALAYVVDVVFVSQSKLWIEINTPVVKNWSGRFLPLALLVPALSRTPFTSALAKYVVGRGLSCGFSADEA